MGKRLTILVIPLAVALAVVGAGVGESAEPGNERAARQDAERRLESFSPPPDAEEVDDLPNDVRFDGPGIEIIGPDNFYVGRLWTDPEPVGKVREWLESAVPPGSRLTGTGFSGGRGKYTIWTYHYSYPDLKSVARERSLDISVTTYESGSALRGDAFGAWVEPRPESEKIPVGVRTIEIERELLRGEYLPHGTGIVERQLIGDRKRVASIVAGIDGLEVEQPSGPHSCPLEAPRYELRIKFLRAAGDDPVAVASMNSPFGFCSVFALEIEGEEQRPLAEEWIFHRRIRGALERLDDRAG